MRTSYLRLVAAGALATIAAACRTTPGGAAPADIARPAADHHAEHSPASHRAPAAPAAAKTDGARRAHTEADARFMRHMIGHHAQALVMTALVPARTSRADIRLLAERIEVSQRDEIAQMERWLKQRREPLQPAADPHHAHHDAAGRQPAPMPGMLSAEELAALGKAAGAEFDRLFLELMIRHHEGALVMVSELFASHGAGQEVDIFRFASDVDADQRAEIARMRKLLNPPTQLPAR